MMDLALQDEVEIARAVLRKMDSEKRSMTTIIESLRQQVLQADKIIQQQTHQLSHYQRQHQDDVSRLKELEIRASDGQSIVQQRDAALAELQRQHTDLAERHRVATEDLSRSHSHTEQLQSLLRQSEDSERRSRSELDVREAQFTQITARLQTAETQCQDLRVDLATARAQIDALSQQRKSADADYRLHLEQTTAELRRQFDVQLTALSSERDAAQRSADKFAQELQHVEQVAQRRHAEIVQIERDAQRWSTQFSEFAFVVVEHCRTLHRSLHQLEVTLPHQNSKLLQSGALSTADLTASTRFAVDFTPQNGASAPVQLPLSDLFDRLTTRCTELTHQLRSTDRLSTMIAQLPDGSRLQQALSQAELVNSKLTQQLTDVEKKYFEATAKISELERQTAQDADRLNAMQNQYHRDEQRLQRDLERTQLQLDSSRREVETLQKISTNLTASIPGAANFLPLLQQQQNPMLLQHQYEQRLAQSQVEMKLQVCEDEVTQRWIAESVSTHSPFSLFFVAFAACKIVKRAAVVTTTAFRYID